MKLDKSLPIRLKGMLLNCVGAVTFAFFALTSIIAWPDPESDRGHELGDYLGAAAYSALWISALWTSAFFVRAFWRDPFPSWRFGLAPFALNAVLTAAVLLLWWDLGGPRVRNDLPFPFALNAVLCIANAAYAAHVAWQRRARQFENK